MAYFTLVRLIIEYGCAARDSYLSRDIKTLEQIQNRALRFIFRLQGGVMFTDLRNKTNIELLKEQRKTVRPNLYCKSVDNGVISDTHYNAPLRTQQSSKNGLYIPSIETNAFFNLFRPRQLVKLGRAFKFLFFLLKKCPSCSFLLPFRQNEFLHPFALYKWCSIGIFDLIPGRGSGAKLRTPNTQR